MKKLLPFIIVLSLLGCATKPTASQSAYNEYEIVRLALEQYTIKAKKIKIIEKPANSFIVDYFEGIHLEFIELQDSFSFADNPTSLWDKKLLRKIVPKKIMIVKDYNTIKKVPDSEPEKADLFFSFSNPIFSNDGQYSLINVTKFGNFNLTPYDSDILIFKKINGQWVYQDKFAAYFS